MNRNSLGIIEVVGFTAASVCIDSMVKSAFVEVTNIHRIGSGMVAVTIEGDLASVQVALQTGATVGQSLGEVVAVRAIPRPYEGLDVILSPEEKSEKT